MKFVCILFFFVLFCHSGEGAQKSQTQRNDYKIPIAGNKSEMFTSSSPDLVGVSCLLKGGESGKGALLLEVRQKSNKTVEISGPEMKLPGGGPFISSRRIILSLKMKFSDAPDHLLEIRFRQNNGRWSRAVSPHSNWNTLIDPQKIKEWTKWKQADGAGSLEPDVESGRLIFLVKPNAGHGRILIEQIVLSDIRTQNHLFLSKEKDHIFNTDSAEMKIRYAEPEHIVSGSVTVSDEENRKLDEILIIPGTQTAVYRMKDRGFYQFTADAVYADGKRIHSRCSAAVLGPALREDVRRNSRFGLCRIWGSSDFIRKIGSNMDYGSWHLDGVRPDASGALHFDGRSGSVWSSESTWHAAMFSPLPKYLLKKEDRNKTGLLPPENWNRLAEAVRVWARNTKRLPEVIDIFNEPDAHWRGSAEDLVKFHNVICKAIKQERPEAKVGGPCFYGIRMKDFKRYVGLGILKGMDYVTMHAYVNKSAPEGDFIERIIAMQEYLSTTPYRDLPIAFTEYGWTSTYYSWQYPVDELTKARYCARSAILCAARDIKHILYFCGKWYGNDEQPRYSILNADSTPLPATAAYGALIRELAEVKNGGIWLKLDPKSHAALFPRGGQTLGAFWTEDPKQKDILLPQSPLYVRSMTGKALAPNRKQRLSPSPFYASFSGNELAEIKFTAGKSYLPGARIPVNGEQFIFSPLMKHHGNGVFECPETSLLGHYTILSRIGKRWTAYPLEIIQPLPVIFSGIRRSRQNGPQASLVFKISSEFSEKVKAAAELRLDGQPDMQQEILLEPGRKNELAFPLAELRNGKRYTGSLDVSITGPIRWSVQCLMDTTSLLIPFFEQEPGPSIWNKLSAIDMNSFYRKGDFDEKDRSRTPASFQMYASPSGIHLQVTALDQDHNRSGTWGEMWKADSLQVAFDIDAEEPWRPNDVGNGFNGHRVVVYGLARHWKNLPHPEGWCWMNHAEGVQIGPPDEIIRRSRVIRDEKRKITVYTLRIPWKFLGVKSPPAMEKLIGFALLLNDVNGKGRRTKVNYFNGIDSQDPTLYGRIRLIKSALP